MSWPALWKRASLVGVVLLAGCPAAPTSGPAEPGPSRGAQRRVASRRPPPRRIQAIEVQVRLPLPPRPGPVTGLPPFKAFRDPFPLPQRSLKRERNLAYRARGRKRQVIITHRAARRWKLANRKSHLLRALKAAGGDGDPERRARIERLQRKISAHLRECVTLLEGVLETRRPPRAALVRLAHYLRKLKPAAAIPLFRKLVQTARWARRKRAYALDLVHLLVAGGRAGEALKVLRQQSLPKRAARFALLRVLALRFGGGRQTVLRQALTGLVGQLATAPPSIRAATIGHLPGLLAGLHRPATLLPVLLTKAPALRRAQGRTMLGHLVQRLVAAGRPAAAREVVKVISARGVTIPGPVRARIRKLAGPWSPTAEPPLARLWQMLVQARLPALAACFRTQPPWARWSMNLRVSSRGRVRSLALNTGQVNHVCDFTAKPVKDPLLLCIVDVARHWRFPPWRAKRRVLVQARVQSTRPGS